MYRKHPVNLVGSTFGRLTVVSRSKDRVTYQGNLLHYWVCRCECGRVSEKYQGNLVSGKTRSCGERSCRCVTTHNMSNTPTYRTWVNIRTRCENPNTPYWPAYGGRGITVSRRWQSFEAFLADMGPRPNGASLDRIDNDGPYSKANCRWATRRTQMRNTRRNIFVSAFGRTLVIEDWSSLTGIHKNTLTFRIKSGWPAELALTLPPLRINRRYLKDLGLVR